MNSGSWFANKGQAIQAIVAVVACIFAGVKALPDMRRDNLLSIGTVLFILLVFIVVISLARTVHKDTSADPGIISQRELAGAPLEDAPLSLVSKGDSVPQSRQAETQSRPETFPATVRVGCFEISLGSYVDLPEPFDVRVECKEIRPTDPQQRDVLAEDFGAVLYLATKGCLVYGGEKTVRVSVNRYYLPWTTHSEKGPYSVYYHHFADRYARVFVLHLDHVNQHKGVVLVKACAMESLADWRTFATLKVG